MFYFILFMHKLVPVPAQHGKSSDGSEGGERTEEEQQSLALMEKTRVQEILYVPGAIW